MQKLKHSIMKIFGITINGNLIGQVLIGIFISWLVGLGISWINVFGHSGQAPLICAMAGGIYAVGRLVRQHRKLTKDNISWLLNTADRVVESLVRYSTDSVGQFAENFGILNNENLSDRQEDKRKTSANSRFAKAGVSCFYDSAVLNSSFVHLMKFSAENPRLRKAAKRYGQV